MAKAIGVTQCCYKGLQTDWETGEHILCLSIPKSHTTAVRQIVDDINQREAVQLTFSAVSKKRTLDQNAYLWVLLGEIAKALNQIPFVIYKQMLERYGVWTLIAVIPEAIPIIEREYRLVVQRGDISLGKVMGIKLQCFLGSSKYDSSEMKVLIDGVISECDEMGIPTDPKLYEGSVYV